MYVAKNKISDFGLFTVRDEETYEYGGRLVYGSNEMVGDFFWFAYPGGHEGEYTTLDIKVVGRLPDDSVIFAFAGRAELKFSSRNRICLGACS